MSKKLIELGLVGMIVFSLVGCGKSGDNVTEKSKEEVKNAKTQEFNIDQDKFKDVKGEWIKDFTAEDFENTGNELLKKVKDKSEELGLGSDIKEEDKVDSVEGQTAKVKSIYLDNNNPKENKIESIQFEVQTIGEACTSGRYQMKISLKFDGKKAIEDNKFKLEDTNMPKYLDIMVQDNKRDYSEINTKIMDIIKSEKGQGVFEAYVDGLKEEFAVSQDYIVCTLTTKEYKFIQGESAGL